ncbi:MAG: twin-arginine translocase TatA/TatE family subunit [Bdellovibrionales bacterium]|nr:twin-arginine translocase TatA/TatE family subunit [Bdellovibrionales bacterium]
MSGSHLVVLAIILLIVFMGPRSLPGLGRGLGDAIRGFKKGLAGEDEDEIDVTESAREKLEGPSTKTSQKQSQRDRNKV